jgi:AcrR family transcriptional regulator
MPASLKAKERLLRAAIKVFSDKGFTGASTREIAKRARVNPVTLFRTFATKEQLHAAAVDYLISGLQIRNQVDAIAQHAYPAPQFIAAVIKVVVDVMLTSPESLRIVLYSALEKSEVGFTTVLDRLLPILEHVKTHVSRYMDKGELRKGDPLVATRLIFAAAIYHSELYELYGGKKISGFDQADLSARYAELLFEGLKP